jgi:4-hydroxy-3-polyprenylbenzoate decarboxylase
MARRGERQRPPDVAPPDHRRVVVGVTGASGAVYAARAVRALLELDCEVHLSLTAAGSATWAYELSRPFRPDAVANARQLRQLHVHRIDDLFAPIASGSFRHRGMLIVPCSARTLAAVASGLSDNTVTRAADVCLKERRPLVLVVREAPLSRVHLENMLRASDAGALVLPASPGFYHRPRTIDDLVDFVVARALDHLGLEHTVGRRWRDPPGAVRGRRRRGPAS